MSLFFGVLDYQNRARVQEKYGKMLIEKKEKII